MDPVPGESYPLQIKALRARLGLTQVTLAERIGVSFATVNRWENAKSKPSKVCWTRLLELDRKETAEQEKPAAGPAPGPTAAPRIDFTAQPKVVRTLVEGERLSFGHLANPTFASETARIDPLPHQRIAVYERMLQQPRLRFLLADDAGAGKTIMSGLYIREMLSRRLLQRILIVAPAGLVGNWQSELKSLFGLQFNIIEGGARQEDNPFTGPAGDRVIAKIDTLAGPRLFGYLQANIQPYELVIFDEAHKLGCDRGGDYRVRKTNRYCLAEAIAGAAPDSRRWRLPWRANHLLLLTATPHMGKDYPYYALWRLLEPEVLSTFEVFEQLPPERRQRHFIRRTKEEMVALGGDPLYPQRIADTLGFELTQGPVSEQSLYEATTEYLRHVYNRSKILNQSAARLAMGVFQRRLASSTHALWCSFQRRIEKLSAIIEEVQAGRITIEQILNLQRQISESDDVLSSRTADDEDAQDGIEENERSEDRLLQSLIATSLAELAAEREQVEELRDLAARVLESGQGSKFDKLAEVVRDPKLADEKMIVFTEHRDTLDYLVRRLDGMGYSGRVATIHGGMDYRERQAAVDQLRRPIDQGGARFMVCTDAAAEGINLQFCWIMINFDVPWNPARLEQRMGRIHRYGQQHDPVIILNLVAPATREGRVLKTLLDKLENIRRQLRSDKVYDSIGRLFSEVSIRQYMEMALVGDVEAIARQLDGRLTPAQVKALADQERDLYGPGGEVATELPRLRERIDRETFFRLIPGYVRRFVQSAAPLVDLEIEGNFGDAFTLRAARSGAADPILTVLENVQEKQPPRISISRPEPGDDCVWMHPGEPVFERFTEIVRQRLSENALRGGVFVDPTAARPYLFHLARLTVMRQADPEYTALAHEETLECRLVGVRQAEGVEIDVCPVEHLLLLGEGYGLAPEAQRLAAEASRYADQARAFLTERMARRLALERRERLLDKLSERETFVKRGYAFQEAELAAARAKVSRKAREGKAGAEQQLAAIKARQRTLSERRERAMAVLRREPELITPGEVVFVAHALIVPARNDDAHERHQAGVEQVAMDLVTAAEEAAGAAVKSVHTPKLARAAGLPDHPGFDILSVRPDGERRCIEVKGRAATGDIEVTDNEWARACNLRSKYWLYAVYHCATPTPRIVRVQDPFEKLLVRPFTKTQHTQSVREVSGAHIGHAQVIAAGASAT